MKKTLSIIMALCIVLSVCFFSVSAAEAKVGTVAADYKPEGTAITDAAGFAAMAADGIYYLANDITLDATWNAGVAVSETYTENTAFTGTLDGNGKTITTSAPLFANLQGTVKNLTLAGAIDGAGLNCGVVTMWTNGTLTVENVLNKATIVNGNTTGGILGYGATGTVATFTNCQNNADLIAAEDGSNVVEKKADGSFANPAKEVPEDTKPAEPVPTGDSALIFAIVALISVLGIAVVAKRKEN